MTDGSNQIRWLDPASSEPLSLIIHYENGDSASKTIPLIHSVKTLSVTDNNGPVSDLNEPELINGFLYVNQYRTYYILKIDTASGKVIGRLDLTTLAEEAKNKYPPSAEMNGIAYDSATNKVYITGKLWPNIYELKFSY
jgi:glutamine cyclotransferase